VEVWPRGPHKFSFPVTDGFLFCTLTPFFGSPFRFLLTTPQDIPGMNKLNAERDELKFVPRDGETADTFKTRLLALALKLKERRDTLKANSTEEVLADLVKEYMKKTDKLLGGGAGGGAVDADGDGNGGEGKKSRSRSTNDVGALAAAAAGGGSGGPGLDYPRLQITPEDAAYLKRLAAARAPASPRAAKAAAAAAAGATAPANTEKVRLAGA